MQERDKLMKEIAMHPQRSEILILKPTSVFLAFLATQLPKELLPSLKLLQTDNTAYVIPKMSTDLETLDLIERQSPSMFHHEISRWLGETAFNEIENSILDFFCCFKFELHSHIFVLESSLDEGQQILRIRPTDMLLNWVKSVASKEQELVEILDQVTLKHLTENATVIVKNFTQLDELKNFLQKNYRSLFEIAMSRMSNDPSQWPFVNSLNLFKEYFFVELHTQLIHLND